MENLDLTQILKDCPKGTKLYSPLFGVVKVVEVDNRRNYPIIVQSSDGEKETFMADGKYYNREYAECLLFPSRECRDWSTFKPEQPKPEPKFKPFDRVLVRDPIGGLWDIDLYGSFDASSGYHRCLAHLARVCIPYEGNEALLGTTDEPNGKEEL